MARILSCVSSAKRGWSSAEKIDKSSRVNFWMPNWRRTKFRSKKAIDARTIVSRRFVSRGVPKHHQAGRRKTRRRPRPREREEKRERERARFEERKRKVRDRPTFLYLFFNAGINGDIFKALFRNNHKKEPFKNISVEKRKTFNNPLKQPPPKKKKKKKKKRTIERTMLAKGCEWKSAF